MCIRDRRRGLPGIVGVPRIADAVVVGIAQILLVAVRAGVAIGARRRLVGLVVVGIVEPVLAPILAWRRVDIAGRLVGIGRRRVAVGRRLIGIGPVSYTHLRAHETPEHLVCRLLLEK